MFKRFIKAMEYRSYCMAIRELRNRGYYKKPKKSLSLKIKCIRVTNVRPGSHLCKA